HRNAESGFEEKRLSEPHQHHRDAEDQELVAADPQAGDADRARHRDVVAPEVVAPDEAHDVLEHERDPDRGDRQRERASAARRLRIGWKAMRSTASATAPVTSSALSQASSIDARAH